MAKNQLHGTKYEDYIKAAFPGSSNHSRLPDSKFDIEPQFDKLLGIGTSVKTSKTNTICMADARRFWTINETYRLLIAPYTQYNDIKTFSILHEFIITQEEHKILLGDITFDKVNDIHSTILTYKFGEHSKARQYAKDQIKQIKTYNKSLITLNPKIDSKDQRRLQCSILLSTLTENIKNHTIYNNDDFYRDIPVEFRIKSSTREFHQKLEN